MHANEKINKKGKASTNYFKNIGKYIRRHLTNGLTNENEKESCFRCK